MSTLVDCVLLIDDDRATNFFNERVVAKHSGFNKVNTVQSGMAALEYLNNIPQNLTVKPNLIFLDINMPAMNGWEFLIEFSKLDTQIREGIKVILLTTSSNPDDVRASSTNHSVDDFINKPLSPNLLDSVLKNHFNT